jgi:hypothetical protein
MRPTDGWDRRLAGPTVPVELTSENGEPASVQVHIAAATKPGTDAGLGVGVDILPLRGAGGSPAPRKLIPICTNPCRGESALTRLAAPAPART